MKRLKLLLWSLGFASVGWVARGNAQDTGTPPPVRITPTPVAEYLPSLRTDREGVRSTLAWTCEVLFGDEVHTTQPPAHPSDCRTEISGRNRVPAEGEENGTGATRGEL